MFNTKKLFYDLFEKYPLIYNIKNFDKVKNKINKKLDTINNPKLLKNYLQRKLSIDISIYDNLYMIALNYNYLFSILYKIDKKFISNIMINKYLSKIKEYYEMKIVFRNIVSHNINNLYNDKLLSNKMIISVFDRHGYSSITQKCAINILPNIPKINLNKFIHTGFIKMYLNHNNLTNKQTLKLISQYVNGPCIKYISVTNTNYGYIIYKHHKIKYDTIITILNNNNYPKTTHHFKQLLNIHDIVLNFELCEYFYEKYFDMEIMIDDSIVNQNLEKYDINLYEKLINKYSEQKIKMLTSFFDVCNYYEYINIYYKHDPEYDFDINYYKKLKIILLNIIKSFDVNDLYKIDKILYKFYHLDTFDDINSDPLNTFINTENEDIHNIYEYFLYLGYIPNKQSLIKVCKHSNWKYYCRFTLFNKLIPDQECFEKLLNYKNCDTKKVTKILQNIIRRKVPVNNIILKNCIDYDKHNETTLSSIIMKYAGNIDNDILLYSIKKNVYIDHLNVIDKIFDEKIYYECHIAGFNAELYKFDIDGNVLELRKMFKTSSFKAILNYMEKYDMEPDNYCFSNSSLNRDNKVFEYMSDKYIMPLSCLQIFMINKYINKHDKYDIHSILTENIEYLLNDKENYLYMAQKCTIK